MEPPDAPIWYDNEQASAWQAGWSAAHEVHQQTLDAIREMLNESGTHGVQNSNGADERVCSFCGATSKVKGNVSIFPSAYDPYLLHFSDCMGVKLSQILKEND